MAVVFISSESRRCSAPAAVWRSWRDGEKVGELKEDELSRIHHESNCRRRGRMMGKLKKLTGYRLFLPLSCLIIVLLINLITTPTFFRITINNGVLYGYIIDVINRASELVVLAVGMTLVVSASAGTDISVGAVMAVAASVCTCAGRRRGLGQ